MKVFYIASVNYPSKKAHGVQMIKTANALHKLFLNIKNIDFEIFLSLRKKVSPEAVVETYKISSDLKMKQIFSPDTLWLKSIGFYLQKYIFAFHACIVLLRDKNNNKVVYSRDIFSLFIISFTGIPYFVELQDFPKINILWKRVIKKAKGITSTTNSTKDYVVNHFDIQCDIKIVRNGADIEEFDYRGDRKALREELEIPINKKVVVYTGSSFLKWKGIDVLVESANFFTNDMLLYIVGGTEDQISELSKYANDKVIFTGLVPYSDVPKWTAVGDVLVLPTVPITKESKFATSPIKLFEYMASGVPIVATNTPANSEILNSNNSVLVKPGEPDDLYKGILKVLNLDDRGQRLAKQARLDVNEHGWESRSSKIFSLIQENIDEDYN